MTNALMAACADAEAARAEAELARAEACQLQNTVAGLQCQVEGMKDEVAGLKGEVAALKVEIGDFKGKLIEATSQNVLEMLQEIGEVKEKLMGTMNAVHGALLDTGDVKECAARTLLAVHGQVTEMGDVKQMMRTMLAALATGQAASGHSTATGGGNVGNWQTFGTATGSGATGSGANVFTPPGLAVNPRPGPPAPPRQATFMTAPARPPPPPPLPQDAQPAPLQVAQLARQGPKAAGPPAPDNKMPAWWSGAYDAGASAPEDEADDSPMACADPRAELHKEWAARGDPRAELKTGMDPAAAVSKGMQLPDALHIWRTDRPNTWGGELTPWCFACDAWDGNPGHLAQTKHLNRLAEYAKDKVKFLEWYCQNIPKDWKPPRVP